MSWTCEFIPWCVYKYINIYIYIYKLCEKGLILEIMTHDQSHSSVTNMC